MRVRVRVCAVCVCVLKVYFYFYHDDPYCNSATRGQHLSLLLISLFAVHYFWHLIATQEYCKNVCLAPCGWVAVVSWIGGQSVQSMKILSVFLASLSDCISRSKQRSERTTHAHLQFFGEMFFSLLSFFFFFFLMCVSCFVLKWPNINGPLKSTVCGHGWALLHGLRQGWAPH